MCDVPLHMHYQLSGKLRCFPQVQDLLLCASIVAPHTLISSVRALVCLREKVRVVPCNPGAIRVGIFLVLMRLTFCDRLPMSLLAIFVHLIFGESQMWGVARMIFQRYQIRVSDGACLLEDAFRRRAMVCHCKTLHIDWMTCLQTCTTS